ncbi:Protein-S-isoprenylcysteine O-methyltransferase Ste14 [Pseudomonas pohangensis]|uniref:Protein-S-isoprenylcysteine O-methyltransferase Ste14 n=1 Tax=Pseudomonas pohangensis TaxID=364197 RepID=A0A1H2H771_9PSED|nr:isoprenylcysteine carboxylmethyltransferase family protein [Pseudomonas pohangensis]SDU27665.1 Protein-S-isoprenylcysteine O-methyltransferase Ste14 [Pseudomonas pohangensis]
MNSLELKVPPVVLVFLAAMLMWLISLVAPSFNWRPIHSGLIALIFILAGGLISALGVLAFRQAKTTVNPTSPETVSLLVVKGIYNLSRNPMYLGFLLTLVGLALLVENKLSFGVLPAFVAYMNRFQIAPEEKVLSAKFGQEFGAYMQRVRRWV